MEFRKVLALRGPNYWANFPVLEAWLDLIPRFSLAPRTKPQLHSGSSNNGVLRLDLAWDTA